MSTNEITTFDVIRRSDRSLDQSWGSIDPTVYSEDQLDAAKHILLAGGAQIGYVDVGESEGGQEYRDFNAEHMHLKVMVDHAACSIVIHRGKDQSMENVVLAVLILPLLDPDRVSTLKKSLDETYTLGVESGGDTSAVEAIQNAMERVHWEDIEPPFAVSLEFPTPSGIDEHDLKMAREMIGAIAVAYMDVWRMVEEKGKEQKSGGRL